MPPFTPPKPPSRPDDAGIFARLRLFRGDIFQSQPAKLYRAWMAEMRGPVYRSYLVNQPELVAEVLSEALEDFPKDGVVRDTLRPLLGNSVFVTNGPEWQAQRRIIDPAFEHGRLRQSFDPMKQAIEDAVARLAQRDGQIVEIEYEASRLAADIIFRTLFSIPITDQTARAVFDEFQKFQRAQPVLNLIALLRLPSWIPRMPNRAVRESGARIRGLLLELVEARQAQIKAGTAPDDLATRIMTTPDSETGAVFTSEEMLDQVAIFFLAGHETSASALSWGLYCLANCPDWQDRIATEAPLAPGFKDLSKLPVARDVFREVLRLYPPVPMMLRRNMAPRIWRGRKISAGALVILSPWHLQRHERLWPSPDMFDPSRWSDHEQKEAQRHAYIPFSAGQRVCTGAGFAMMEGTLALSQLCRAFRFEPTGDVPRPVAHLTVRAQNGIRLRVSARDSGSE